MTDPQSWVAPTYNGLADLLTATAVDTWDAPSLCEKWLVRHVIAHVTMPVRLTPEQFGAEMAAAGGDFTTLSDTVAARDASLPVADLLDQLQSPRLHAWQPPGGGAAGALSHAVIHSLDVTIALDRPPVAPAAAVTAVLEQLTAARGTWFGVDLTDVRLEAADTDWSWGRGRLVRADSGTLVALLSGRALPDGRTLPCPLITRDCFTVAMISARSVIFDGKEFGYRMAGESQDTVPVLLLHATGETSESWVDFMLRWAEVGAVYALDLRGHGRSVWEGPYGLDVLAEDVVGFLDAMGLAQVDLVGHSLGGLVGCLVASSAPGCVRKLVLEDVGVPHPRVPAALERPAGPLDFDWDMVGRVRAQIDNPDAQWPTHAGRIQADTLVVAGGPSSPVPQEHVAQMAATIPGARLVTIGGGHMVHDARPDEFAAVVMGHLTRPAG